MARSFGDAAAESVGVHAEPELTEITLGSQDKFVIWASDGVWEFITSQEAVDIVNTTMGDGPLKACEALVKESTKYVYVLWCTMKTTPDVAAVTRQTLAASLNILVFTG